MEKSQQHRVWRDQHGERMHDPALSYEERQLHRRAFLRFASSLILQDLANEISHASQAPPVPIVEELEMPLAA